MPELEKRTWFYIQKPKEFEVSPCSCGNDECEWSEFKGHLWCDKCQKDFIPEFNGIFAGPIPAKVTYMLGIRFDRFNIETGKVERFDIETGKYVVEEK